MAYSFHTAVAPRERTPGVSLARPKTHTPAPRLQQRGLRYYSPELGRWVSRDPIEEDGGLLLYAFCGNEPSQRIDPTGEDWLNCMARCIEDNDPLYNLTIKAIQSVLAAENAIVPKAWIAALYRSIEMEEEAIRIYRLGGRARLLQVGSVSQAVRTIATTKLSQRINVSRSSISALMRRVNLTGQAGLILSGTLEIAVEAHCCGTCLGRANYETPSGNMWPPIYEFYSGIISGISTAIQASDGLSIGGGGGASRSW